MFQGFQCRFKGFKGYQRCSKGVLQSCQGIAGVSGTFQISSSGFRGVPWRFHGVSGDFSDVPGVFQKFPGGFKVVPGRFRSVVGVFSGIPGVFQRIAGAFQRIPLTFYVFQKCPKGLKDVSGVSGYSRYL